MMSRVTTARLPWALSLASLLAACGSSGGGGGGGGGGSDAGVNDAGTLADSGLPMEGGGTPDANPGSDANSPPDANTPLDGASNDTGAPGDGGSCQGQGYGGGEPTMTSATVTAKIADETGAPVAGQPVYICGINLCSPPSTTQADGSVTIQFQASVGLTKPALKVGDSISYAELAIPLSAPTTDFTNGGTTVLNTAKLAGKPGATITPGADAVSGDVTLSVPAGATVGIDTLVYATADSQELRTQSIPLANDGPVLASAGVSGFGLLYGLAPAETPVCPAAKVTVALPHVTMSPNDLGWAPGAAVEFWIMTIDTGQVYAPYAGWAKISDGVVNAAGTSVATVDGQGFDYLQTFAIRKP